MLTAAAKRWIARGPWRDRVLVAVLLSIAVLEGLLRPHVVWRPLALVLGVLIVLLLPARRTRPLLAVIVAFVGIHGAYAAARFADVRWTGLYTNVSVLLLAYALGRYAGPRQVGVGLAFMLWGPWSSVLFGGRIGEAVGGTLVLGLPVAFGAAAQYRSTRRARDLDRARLLERAQLARELHDTVAHYVSAIAVQAQAGRTVARTRPEVADQVLATIEEAAGRALDEMRTIVRNLRGQESAERAPQPKLSDLPRLCQAAGGELAIDVQVDGDVQHVAPGVESTVYRVVQESITNAVRHARGARRVEVRVMAGDRALEVVVRNDGAACPPPADVGFGLVGMAERARLFGGAFEAGPVDGGGWRVIVTLPKQGRSSPGPTS